MKRAKHVWLLLVFLVSYLIGFLAYALVLWIGWEETLGGDVYAVLLWGTLGYIPVALVYLLICAWVRRRVHRDVLRSWLYPVCCALAFMLPTALIFMAHGGGRLFQPEALLFHAWFFSSGITFGYGFGKVFRLCA